MEPIVEVNDEHSIITFFFREPYEIDLITNKVKYTTRPVIIFDYHKGSINSELFYIIENELETLLQKSTITLLAQHIDQSTSLSNESIRKQAFCLRFGLEASIFEHCIFDHFLYRNLSLNKKNTFISLLEKLYKDHSEGIKTAIYQRYKYEKKDNTFDIITPYILCQVFDNTDILQNLLSKPLSLADNILTKHEMLIFENSFLDHISKYMIQLLRFLKQHYSEKAIANLLLSTQDSLKPWYDIVKLFSYIQDNDNYQNLLILPEFLTIKRLQDALMRINMLFYYRRRNDPFVYVERFTKACVTIDTLSFKLPLTPVELIRWSQELENCVYSYIPHIKNKRGVIFGVFKNNTLCYTLEIYKNTLTQCNGKHDQNIPDDINKVINQWFASL